MESSDHRPIHHSPCVAFSRRKTRSWAWRTTSSWRRTMKQATRLRRMRSKMRRKRRRRGMRERRKRRRRRKALRGRSWGWWLRLRPKWRRLLETWSPLLVRWWLPSCWAWQVSHAEPSGHSLSRTQTSHCASATLCRCRCHAALSDLRGLLLRLPLPVHLVVPLPDLRHALLQLHVCLDGHLQRRTPHCPLPLPVPVLPRIHLTWWRLNQVSLSSSSKYKCWKEVGNEVKLCPLWRAHNAILCSPSHVKMPLLMCPCLCFF